MGYNILAYVLVDYQKCSNKEVFPTKLKLLHVNYKPFYDIFLENIWRPKKFLCIYSLLENILKMYHYLMYPSV